jgi:hypothetical protein
VPFPSRFTPGTFNLIQDTALDGWRFARERRAQEDARRLAAAAQSEMVMAPAPPMRLPDRRRRLPSVRLGKIAA